MVYIYYYLQDLIKKEVIDQINDICETCSYYKEDPFNTAAINNDGTRLKYSDTSFVKYKDLKPVLEETAELLTQTSRTEFGYNVYNLNMHDPIIYNKYHTDMNRYDWHGDGSDDPRYDIKITALINISQEEYEGGEFQIFVCGEKTVTEFANPGDVILLKSHVQHRVLPVTSGERKTLAIFLPGPKFV